MKKFILTLKRIFSKEKVNGNAESQETHSEGDLVNLVWMIEKLRHPSNKCTMNELLEEVNKHFNGLKGIREVSR
jgi:hypothetical protein